MKVSTPGSQNKERSRSPRNPQSLSPRSRSTIQDPQSLEESKTVPKAGNITQVGDIPARTKRQQADDSDSTMKARVAARMEQMIQKFKAFENRVINETEILEQDLQKCVSQMQFDLQGKDSKILSLEPNWFKQ